MARALTRSALLLLGALTLLRLAVAAATPLSGDEAYYWIWSRALAPGYLDHPPMVALFIRAGTAIAGANALGVRLLGPLSALAGSALLAAAARDLLGVDRVAASRAAVLLNATLMLAAGSVTMTPDTPLIFFWTATLAAFGRALVGEPALFLPLAGFCAGLAFCSKYTAALLLPALAGAVLVHPRTRAWLARPPVYLAAAIGLTTTLPVLLWNARHGFASFAKQGGRVDDVHLARALQFEAELLGGQLGLATPLVFALACVGVALCLRDARRTRAPGPTLVALAALVPAAVFVLHALGGRVQANWPCVVYPAAAIAAAPLAGRGLLAVRPAAALGFALSLLLYLQAATGILPLPGRVDVTLARLAGWGGLAAELRRADRELRPVAADDYALAAELAWHCAAPVVLGAEPRWALFALAHPAVPPDSVLLLRSDHRREAPDPRLWRAGTPIARFERRRDGLVAERYRAWWAAPRLPSAELAVLPQPTRCRPR